MTNAFRRCHERLIVPWLRDNTTRCPQPCRPGDLLCAEHAAAADAVDGPSPEPAPPQPTQLDLEAFVADAKARGAS